MLKRSSTSAKVFYPAKSRDEIIEALRSGAARLAERVPLREAALFGSYAIGRQTVGSDVDVLIVYEGEERDDVFVLAKQLIRVPRLEPHVYSEAQAAALRDVLSRMVRGGVRLLPSTPVEPLNF
jgi:predicted nucleotidyltransferase